MIKILSLRTGVRLRIWKLISGLVLFTRPSAACAQKKQWIHVAHMEYFENNPENQ